MRLKGKNHLYNIKVQREAPSTNAESAALYPEAPAQIIMVATSIFNVRLYETAFHWKETPSRTLIASEEKSVPGF